MTQLSQKFKMLYEKVRIILSSYKVSGITPVRDWKILLSVTMVMVVILALFASYFYIKIDRGEIFTVSNSKTNKEVKIDEKLLKKAINDVNLRESAFTLIKQSKEIPADPSI